MNRPLIRWSAFAVLCLLAALVYLPGLNSGFHLDDAYNLHLLERIPEDGFSSFVFSGFAGPTGRPVSLLTFALQHQSWPDAPHHFKAVNLAIHLACGLVIFLMGGQLARSLQVPPARAWMIALLAAGLWLLHPMHMSTVLYVVQRMTQLSALFMFLGLYGWLLGRSACERGDARRGYLVMSTSVVLGTAAATLSKENGALLPLLILVTDATLLRNRPLPGAWATWRLVFLVLPTLAVAGYLCWKLPGSIASFADRPYSIVQKTVTEAGVLWQYLFDLLLPRPGAFGLYHDDIPVAEGILDPAYALAVLGIALLAGVALHLRKTMPVVAFGVLWFLAGHLLESTHLNLALYFEHRNYLPSAGLAFLLAWTVVPFAAAPGRWWAVAGTAVYVGLLSLVTVQNALMTRVPLLEAYETVRNHPESFGAHALLGNRYIAAGRPVEALELYRRMEEAFPELVYPRLKRTAVRGCVVNEPMDEAWWRDTLQLASTGQPVRYEVAVELDGIMGALFENECSALDRSRLLAVIEALAGNRNFARQRGMLHELAANLSISMSEWTLAHQHMALAARASPTWNRRLRLIELELKLGMKQAAAAKLRRLEGDLLLHPVTSAGHAARIHNLREQLAGGSGRSPGGTER